MNRSVVFVVFVVLAGLLVSITALAGHQRAATIEFVCFVLAGATTPFWFQANRPVRTGPIKQKSRRYLLLGGILIFGGVLQLVVKYERIRLYHEKLGLAVMFEFLFEMLIAYYLLVLARRSVDETDQK